MSRGGGVRRRLEELVSREPVRRVQHIGENGRDRRCVTRQANRPTQRLRRVRVTRRILQVRRQQCSGGLNLGVFLLASGLCFGTGQLDDRQVVAALLLDLRVQRVRAGQRDHLLHRDHRTVDLVLLLVHGRQHVPRTRI